MPRNPMLSKTTATKENALTDKERDDFLAIKQDCHFSTDRGDGWWHLTPLWYVWDGHRFFHTLGASRRHLKNIRGNANVTVCVDADPRLTEGLAAGARSVTCFGVAELTALEDDEAHVRQITDRIMERYIGPDRALYSDAVWAEPRTIVTVTPVSWLTWDYNKG